MRKIVTKEKFISPIPKNDSEDNEFRALLKDAGHDEEHINMILALRKRAYGKE